MKEKEDKAEPAQKMEKTLSELIKVVYMIGVIVFVAYFVFFTFFQDARISTDPGDWGTLGDYFGGLLNPVVSFATLMVAYAVWKQQKDELRQTKEALEEQARTAEQQRQEQRFFDCLNVYARLVDSQTSTGSVGEKKTRDTGREALFAHAQMALLSDEICSHTSPAISRSIGGALAPPPPTISELRKSFQYDQRQRNGLTLSDPYCRGVLATLQVCTSVLRDTRSQYLPLLVEQFTQQELSLLALYLLLVPSSDRYWNLAAETHLFANLETVGILQLSKEHLPPTCFART